MGFTLPQFWRGFRPRVPANDRLVRLRKVLDKAKIPYPRDAPELALSRIPAAGPPLLRSRASAQTFSFPLSTSTRIALLEPGFHADSRMREFGFDDIAWLREYAPDSLVLPLETALMMADQIRLRMFDLPSLDTAVVVLTSLEEPPLADHHRNIFWRAFGVPIFEQLRGWDGTVIASECEVHDGLHIDDAAAILHLHEDELLATQLTALDEPIIRARTGLTGEIAHGPCECGAESARLRRLAPVQAVASTGRPRR